MGKLIPITIAGIVFQVEQEAYSRLTDYLSEVRRHYSQQQSHSILLEIENKIFEVLNLKTNNRAEPVNYLDVLDLIQTIGHVSSTPEPPTPARASLESDSVETAASYEPEGQEAPNKKKKFGRSVKNRKIAGVAEGIGIYFTIDPVFIRLAFIALLSYKGSAILIYLILIVLVPNYFKEEETPFAHRIMRDPDDKVMGGVAAGLAKYFGIDPIFLRVFFIFSILLGGVGIIGYIVLWLLAPLAQTEADRVVMKGRPLSHYFESLKDVNEHPDMAAPFSRWMILAFKKFEAFFNYIKSKKVLYGVIQLVFTGLIIYIFLRNIAGPSFDFSYNNNYDSGFFNFSDWSRGKKVFITLLLGIPALLVLIKIVETLLNTRFNISPVKRGLLLVWLGVMLFVGFKGYLFSSSNREGNGIISIENYDVDSFSSIQVDGEFELDIVKGDKSAVEISIDENLSKYIQVESNGGKLRIFHSEEFGEATQLKVKVTAVDLDEIFVSGHSKVTIDSLTSPTLTIKADGESEIRAKLAVGNLLLNQSGDGRFYFQGKASNATINSAGEIDLNAFNLEASVLNLLMDGQGTAHVNVSERLDVQINGKSQVLYKGDPVINQVINGEGSIKRAE